VKRETRITKLGQSIEDGQYLSKVSFRVAISEGDDNVVVEARITDGVLETVSEPEKGIERWFATRPLPVTNKVIDIPSLD
jgi:hypothetical protein